MSIKKILVTLPASAHQLQVDNNIGAELHVEPQDDPVAGQEAKLYFEITDRTGQFQEGNCDCKVAIERNGQNIFTADLADPVHYTFPEQDSYIVSLSGAPKPGVDFQNFTLRYDIQAQGGSRSSNSFVAGAKQHALHFILFGIAFIIILVLYIKDRKRKSR